MASAIDDLPARAIVVDFDGTVTERDSLELVVHEFGDRRVRRAVEQQLGGALTLNEVIALQYGTLSEPLGVVSEWLVTHSRFRPGFGELVRLAGRRAWPLWIVSSGVGELIGPLLAREGLSDVPVIANSLAGEPPPWAVSFRDPEPCPVCHEACKRRTVARLREDSEVVYIGDGFSDGCAAESADLVFARRRLAAYLQERGVPFEPFDDFVPIVRRLSES